MNTPITKRIHMNAAKKNSIAKQTTPKTPPTPTTETGYYNKNGKRYKYDASSTLPTTNAAGALTETIYDTGKSLEGLSKEQLDWREKEIKRLGGINAYHKKYGDPKKGKAREVITPSSTNSTQGKVDIKDKLVMKEPTKGTTVDTSTAYNIRQISRGQKKAARDVRRAKIKLSKLGIQDTEGNWVAKTGISARNKAKFEERLAELKGMKNTQKRIMDMAKAGVDPRRTARFESGTEMKAGTPGGPDTNVEGLETDEQVKDRLNKGVNLGTVSSKVGDMPQGDALNDILRKNIDKKENAKVTKPVSTAVSNVMSDAASRGYSTALTKRYNSPTSMLKKSGMKMGGFGSKTYKK